MAKLRDIMVRDVVTVSPDATLREVAELLAEHGISGAPVVSGGRVLGVISATDIIEFEASNEPPDEEEEAEEDEVVWEADEDYQAFDENPPAAFFTEIWSTAGDDILERFAERRAAGDPLNQRVAADVMTRNIRSLPPDTELAEAADYLLRTGVHRILVMEGERLEGLVTTTDFVRAVAERRI